MGFENDGLPEKVIDQGDRCGEGPIWHARTGSLIWTDLRAGVVSRWNPERGETCKFRPGTNVASIALHDNGSLVFGGADGLTSWSEGEGLRSILSAHDGEKLPFNDIIVDSAGRIYAGSVHWDARGMKKPGKLYLIETDGLAAIQDDGIEHSNGLGFTKDGKTLYFSDTTARCIYAYEVDPRSGSLSRRRVFVRVPKTEGLPDGLTVDSEDHIWSAQWYGSQVVRYDPEGKVERRISLPVHQISSLAFGGRELTDLYITSAAEPWKSSYVPDGAVLDWSKAGGALFRVRLETAGRPEHLAKLELRPH